MVRKTVTLVFCDVADSTQLGERLDPEALRGVWSRYHETAREALERHGGTVEKFIGDAVMAAFGIPLVHEDDPLRAVRAAAELRDELARLNDGLERDYGVRISVRTGVNTGEVLAGDPAQGQAFATGDAVVVAQRLETAAGGGEILVGDATFRLVRDAVVAEELPPLELKGKSEAVAAWRLLEVLPETPGVSRRSGSPLIERVDELARLRAEFGLAAAERSCRVISILGEPGVGKSRLASELAASLGDEVRLLEGRCLPYGDGITYWPLVEIVRGLDLDAVLAEEADADAVRGRLLEAVGRAEPRARSDELYWAVRRLLETLARERPLLLVLDDVQWAEPAFLDLVEYLAGWSRDAPILVCCLARTEFAEIRPAWAKLPLGPLSPDGTAALLGNLAGPLEPAAALELGRATGGNPLFLEEMVHMLEEEDRLVEHDGVVVAQLDGLRAPDTVQAVLAARLDRLSEDERDTLQRAAVIGQVFFWGAVAELAPPERVAAVAGDLQALVRKGLIRPDPQTLAGEDGFRFAHILVRDAAYDSTAKRLRGNLHARFADWVAGRAGEGAQLDEIIGHHLEQAYAYRLELGPAGEEEARLAARAAERLARAGRRALVRGDAHAAANLLSRAASLEPAAELLVDLAEAHTQLGAVLEAERAYDEAMAAAATSGDARSLIRAWVGQGRIGLLTRAEGGVEQLAEEVARALPSFEASEDDATVARLLTQLAQLYWWRCQIGPMQDALERALEHARRGGDDRLEGSVAVWLGFAAVVGPLPVPEGRTLVERSAARITEDTSSKGMLLLTGAVLAAMAGDFDVARAQAAAGNEILDGLGRSVGLAAISTWTSTVDLLAGEVEAAEKVLRAALAELEAAGQRANVASVAAQLAETLVVADRYEEAAAFADLSEEAAAHDDIHAQIAWRIARAKVSAGSGDAAGAVAVAHEAVDLATTTDSPFFTAEALATLALALAAAGDDAEADESAQDALALFEQKGFAVAAARLRAARAGGRTASTRG